MFNPDGCFCCEPPEDPCVLSGCTWSSTEMSDTDLTAGTAYNNQVSGSTPDGTYEITNVQLVGTGNDPPCRKITIETVEAPHKPDTVYAICWKDNATHNPATQCPLTSVSFCVESKRHDDSDATNSLTDAVVFVVRQNNRIYATASQSVGVNWKRASGTYTQSQFTEIDGAGNPNFTASGLPIEFGFALKLQVNEDEEPYDVVMFDNLCITRNPNCNSCLNTTCDHTNDGSELTARKTSSGITYSVVSSEGLPPDCHRVTFNVSNPSNDRIRIVCDSSLQDIADESGSGCQTMTSVSICFNFKVNTQVVPGGGFYIYADVKPDEVPSGPSTIPTGTPFWNSSTSFGTWRQQTRIVNLSSTIQGNMASYYPVVEISGNGQFDVSIDNICVKAVYGTCFDQEYSVATTGISVIEKTPSCGGTWGSVATEFSGILSGAVVLTRYTSGIPSGTCFYAYRYRSVVDPRYEIVVGMSSINNGTSEKWRLSYLFSGFTHTTLSMSLSQSLECDDIASFSGLSQYLYPSGWTALPSCIQFNPTSPAATVTPV